MSETLILTCGLEAVVLIESIVGLIARFNEAKRIRALSGAHRGDAQMSHDLVQVLVEKLTTNDSRFIAELHSAERSRRDAYRTSLDREALKTERAPVVVPRDPNYDPDGVATENLDEARR